MQAEPGSSRARPRFWDHQRHVLAALRESLEEVLESKVKPSAGDRVVDLGCGERPYEPLFRESSCEYIGCDLEASDGVLLLESGRPVALEDASADGVVSFQVLEHVWDLDWYLGECRRLLKPDGWLLLSTHGTWLYHPHPHDFRRWTRDGLVGEIESRGFEVETVSAVVGPLAWTTQFRLLGIRQALQAVPVLGSFLVPPIAALMNLRMMLEDWVTPAAIRDVNASVYITVCRKRA